MTELSPAARRSPLFANLSTVETQDVSGLASGVEFTTGDDIFHEGDEGDALYVVDHGSVRITKESGGEERTLALLQAGDVIGEMSLLSEGSRSASARAETDCRLLRIDRDGFLELIESHDPVAFKVLLGLSRLLCRRLARVNSLLARGAEADAELAADPGWVSLERLRAALAERSGQ